MPREYFTIDYITSLTDEQIVDLRRNNPQRLEKILRAGMTFASNRQRTALNALERNPDLPTPVAYQTFGGENRRKGIDYTDRDAFNKDKFPFKNKLQNQRMLKDVIDFLNTKTSTIEGHKEYLSKIVGRFGKELGIEASTIINNKKLSKEFWKIAQRASSLSNITGYKYTVDGKANWVTNDLQRIVLGAMYEVGIDKPFNENEKVDDDWYALEVIERIRPLIDRDYERKQNEMRQREEEESSRLTGNAFVLGRDTRYDNGNSGGKRR